MSVNSVRLPCFCPESRAACDVPNCARFLPTTAESRRCTKDDPTKPWLCSCDLCSRAAAANWQGLMDRVMAGEISLGEAQARAVADRKTSDPETLIQTCLVCKVAWDCAMDPPKCRENAHAHALARFGDWDRVCHGRAS